MNVRVVRDKVKIIYGTKGEEIKVDDEDYENLSKLNWNCFTGYARTYRRRKSEGNKLKSELMHRIIMGLPTELMVDHINGNKLDNRRCNLRLCNESQNGANRRKSIVHNNDYLGVTYHKRDNRYQTQVRHKGKRYYCGYFKTAEEAALAYNKKASELHGEFARLNILKDKY